MTQPVAKTTRVTLSEQLNIPRTEQHPQAREHGKHVLTTGRRNDLLILSRISAKRPNAFNSWMIAGNVICSYLYVTRDTCARDEGHTLCYSHHYKEHFHKLLVRIYLTT